MRQAAWGFVLVAFLAAPSLAQSPTSGWTQMGGDAAHSGIAFVGDAPVDVVASYSWRASPSEELLGGGAGFVATPAGPTALVMTDVGAATTVCQLLRITDLERGVVQRFGPTIACNNGARMMAYDPERDALIIELDGTPSDPLVQAWDATTGEMRWGAAPQALGVEAPAVQDNFDWIVYDIALDLDSDTLYATFLGENSGRHRIAAISAEDGTVHWSSVVPVTLFGGVGSEPLAPEVPPAAWNATQAAASGAQSFAPNGLAKPRPASW